MKENIKVAIRLRPVSDEDKDGQDSRIQFVNKNELQYPQLT